MDAEKFYEQMPYANHLDIEITSALDGQAEGRMPVVEMHSWDTDEVVAHGGALFSFADVVGGAAVRSVIDHPTPTIDMRIDYFRAANCEVSGTAEMVRRGKTTGTVDVEIHSDGVHVADARGVYKISPP